MRRRDRIPIYARTERRAATGESRMLGAIQREAFNYVANKIYLSTLRFFGESKQGPEPDATGYKGSTTTSSTRKRENVHPPTPPAATRDISLSVVATPETS